MKHLTKQTLGKYIIRLGVVLIVLALLLFGYDTYRTHKAEEFAKTTMEKIKDLKVVGDMPVVEIDGYEYIGYVSIPRFGQELPVMSEYDTTRLNLAPCRHFGSTTNDDLIIAGHNFPGHFGNLMYLGQNDVLKFSTFADEEIYYRVVSNAVYYPNQTKAIQDSGWDLVLYTCTWSGYERTVIGANRISKEEYAALGGK